MEHDWRLRAESDVMTCDCLSKRLAIHMEAQRRRSDQFRRNVEPFGDLFWRELRFEECARNGAEMRSTRVAPDRQRGDRLDGYYGTCQLRKEGTAR